MSKLAAKAERREVTMEGRRKGGRVSSGGEKERGKS